MAFKMKKKQEETARSLEKIERGEEFREVSLTGSLLRFEIETDRVRGSS